MSIKNIIICMLFIFPLTSFAQADEQAIHNELRGILKGLENAINAGKWGDLAQYFHKNMRVTTINQEVISAPKEIEPYFVRWFGPGGYLKKLKITLTADALTEFYADHSIGVVRGSGNENYHLSDERYFEMKTRWTATVIKDEDGKWKILTLHIGTNFLDNPILAKAENSLFVAGVAGALVSLVLCVIVFFVILRRRKNAG